MARKSLQRATPAARRKKLRAIAALAFHRSFNQAFNYLAEVNPKGYSGTAVRQWLAAMRAQLRQCEESQKAGKVRP